MKAQAGEMRVDDWSTAPLACTRGRASTCTYAGVEALTRSFTQHGGCSSPCVEKKNTVKERGRGIIIRGGEKQEG